MLRLLGFFHKKNIELEKTKKAAKEASQYARSIILKTSTRLENNELSKDAREHLHKGIQGTKYKAHGRNDIGIRDIIAEQTLWREQQCGESATLARFRSVIDVTTKYSIGNCEELAFQALHYVCQHYPNLPAEIFEIENGDHCFLVLNRDPNSHPNSYRHWGLHAVICDPWANDIYAARHCKRKLKSYSFEAKKLCNRVQPFDPQEQFLRPMMFSSMLLQEEVRLLR